MQPLPNSLHVHLHAIVRDDGVAALEERGDVALIRTSSTPRRRVSASTKFAVGHALGVRLLGRAMLGKTVVAAIIYGFVGTDKSNDFDHFVK